MQEKVKDEMNKVFNPEFLNRLDDVIVFHPLTKEHIAQIVTILLKEVQRRLGDEVRLTPGAPSSSWSSTATTRATGRVRSSARSSGTSRIR